jgi:hypothetical protein
MFRFIDVAPRVAPVEALLIGVAVLVGGVLLFGLTVLWAKKLAKSGASPGARRDPE